MSAQANLSAIPFAIANSTLEAASKQTGDNRPFFFASQTAVVTFAKRLKASRTGAMKNFLVLFFLLGVTSVFACDVNAQLLYTTLNNSNQPFIRQTNLDGTGNTVFNINGLASASDTKFSNDGRLLAVTGQTFSQQGQISSNVFTFDPATNQTRQITNFSDFVDPGNGNRLFKEAVFKSFSPDGTRLAVVGHTLFIPQIDPFRPQPTTKRDGTYVDVLWYKRPTTRTRNRRF